MSQTPTPRPPGSRGDVVEERIDHEVRRIAGQVGELLNFARGNPVVLSKLHEIIDALERLARIDLLTEHSAREEFIQNIADSDPWQDRDGLAMWWREKKKQAKELLALPATESAQPEEDRTEAWVHSPERESPPVEAEEERNG